MSDTGPAPPRTLLEVLVRQRRWSHQDFCTAYAQAATNLGLTLTVSTQHAGRWFAAKLKGRPYPSQCRVLEHMFNLDVEQLFQPMSLDGAEPEHLGPGVRTTLTREPVTSVEEIAMAADEAARFTQFAEQTNVGPHTLEQFAADIHRIVTVYPNRPVYPLFVEVRSLRARAFEKLEGRQFPDQTRDLYLAAGILTGILANASFDLGRLAAAETQARTAFLCAELAGSNWLRAWIRGTQALVAYWDDRPAVAVQLAADGHQYVPESGTAAVRLAAIAARAHGMLHDTHAVRAALVRAEAARDAVIEGDTPAGMMEFPDAKQRFYAATAHLWLAGSTSARQAHTEAQDAVTIYEQAPPEHRRLGELNLARLDLATSHMAMNDLDATLTQIRPVLAISKSRPTDSVTRRLRQVDAALSATRYRSSTIAATLRNELHTAITASPRPALPAGDHR